jgi:PAS domain S-box-containing protein
MEKEKNLIIISIVTLILANWIIFAFFDSIEYELSFFSSLWYVSSEVAIIKRLVGIVIILIFALLMNFIIKKRRATESELLKFKKAVQTSGEVVFITNVKGIFKFINPEFTKVYGYEKEDVVNITTPRILKSGVMNEAEYKYFWETITSGEVVKGELINKTKSGKLLIIEGSANPIFNEKNEIIGFLAIQRDISERKNAEERLIESDKLARALLNAPKDPAYLLDTQGVIQSVNEAGIDIIGLSGENLIGYSIYDFKHKNVLFDKSDAISKVIETKASYSYEIQAGNKHYESTIYPLFGLKGEVSGIAVFDKDISLQKQTEIQLKEQNAFLQNVIESLPHPFYVIDIKDYSIVLANSASGIVTESKRRKCYEVTHNRYEPCDGKDHICPIEHVLESKKPFIVEHIHYDKYNNPRNIEVHAYPIFDNQGNIVKMIEYSLDVTDRIIAENRIKELSKQVNK